SCWGPRYGPPTPQRSDRPGNPWRSSILLGARYGPQTPDVRTGPGNPWRSSILVGGPDMAPKPPPSARPGKPVALLYLASSLVRSVGQDVPPDAGAGEDDHHEQYPLESNA